MKANISCALLLFMIQSGCPDDAPQTKIVKTNPPTTATPTHRFMITRDQDLAFDTQTGQLCRTWDWAPMGVKLLPDKEGNIPERKPGELTPTCITLYNQYSTRPGGPNNSAETSAESAAQ